MLQRLSSFVALHKEKHVIPIVLTVQKVSGIGEDTMFMVRGSKAFIWQHL